MSADATSLRQQTFVFLQGPPGPLFHRLAAELRRRGARVYRINLSAGDWIDWKGEAVNFRGSFSQWPVFFDDFLQKKGITDLLLFGDCRPYHVTALRLAEMRGIHTHVLEEGYLRPDWMTLEREGVNAHSRLPKDRDWIRSLAGRLPAEQSFPPITASFRRRVRDAARYYTAVQMGGIFFPHYRNHRQEAPLFEAFGWAWKFLTRRLEERRTKGTLARLEGRPFFLFPLQLSGDFQIRAHSPFPDMPAATAFVLSSFAAHAPFDATLLIKEHPLDSSFFPWRSFVRRWARRLGIANRVLYVAGGDLEELSERARGMVVVNSTSATLALRAGRPVCVLGDAIYRMSGLTFEGHLDQFWTDPVPPEPGLYEAFRKLLVDQCLVRGGLASESAVTTLVGTMADRLCGEPPPYSLASQGSTASKWARQLGSSSSFSRSS
jgi:capsular polysaccharide export protein